MKKSMTFIELVIVIIIMSILVTIALVQYWKMVERAKIAKAKNTIGLIYFAEFMHLQQEGVFVAFSGYEDIGFLALDGHLELDSIPYDTEWAYSVDNVTNNTFTIHAKRTDGIYKDKEITFNKSKVWAGDHPL